MHTVFVLLCFVVVIHWLIFPYPSGLLHWHCGNLTIAPVPAKQPWWIWINISCEFIMNDCITTTKLSTTKPCAYFLGYTVHTKNCAHDLWFVVVWHRLHCPHMRTLAPEAGMSGRNMYCKTFSISHTKSQNLNVSCIVLRLSSLNPLKPGVKLRTQM